MGIQKFFPLLQELGHIPEKRGVGDFRGKTIAVDVSLFLHKYASDALRRRPNNHLCGFFSMIFEFRSRGVDLVMVMDGRPSESKRKTLEARAQQRERCVTLLNAAESSEALQAISKGMSLVTPQMYADVRELFALAGIPTIVSEGEADWTLAALARAGMVDAVLSEDGDLLALGTPVLLKNYARNREMQEYSLEAIRKSTGASAENLRDVACRLRNDYSAATITVGKAIEMLRGKADVHTGSESGSDPISMETFRKAMEVAPPPVPKKHPAERENLLRLLVEKCQLKESNTQKRLRSI
ncbi:MAG: PIN domain-containing protein [Sulfobacillus sp.]